MSYNTKTQLLQLFFNLENEHKDEISHEVFGKSVLDDNLYLFKIGNSEGCPVMFDSVCHGWEKASAEVMYLYAKWLVESNSDEAKRILNQNLTLLIPIVCPDTYAGTKKNANGVDLNRNFDWNWEGIASTGGGVSDDPESPVYRGTAPLTEPECCAFKELWNKYKPIHYLNTHIGSAQKYVWYVRFGKAEDKAYMIQIFQEFKQKLEEKGLTPPALQEDGGTGNFQSTPYHTLGVFGWCCELHTTNPPYAEIPALFDYWLPFFVMLSDESYKAEYRPHISEVVNVSILSLSFIILLSFILKDVIVKFKEVK